MEHKNSEIAFDYARRLMEKARSNNSEIAFDHAIKVGALSAAPYEPHGHGLESWPCSCPWFGFAGDYMYMYSEGGLDYFKHIDTREYIKVRAAL